MGRTVPKGRVPPSLVGGSIAQRVGSADCKGAVASDVLKYSASLLQTKTGT